jgi:fatty-acyl-CoA synthase
VGLPHPKWGEAVNAVVALKAGAQVSEAMLVKLIADRKGSFQAPKAVHFIEAIPLTAVGKPDKKALRELYGRQPT